MAIGVENARLLRRISARSEELERANLQQAAMLRTIRELSSPVVPIADGILVMPVVGVMDAQRSSDFIASMLREIDAKRAHVVLIDVTGMAFVDATAASRLVEAAQAAALLGAEAVLVGIRPEAAQMMVRPRPGRRLDGDARQPGERLPPCALEGASPRGEARADRAAATPPRRAAPRWGVARRSSPRRRAPGAPLPLGDVHHLVEDDGHEDDGADDDERPVRVEAPDARHAVVAVADLEHVDAVVDDPHEGRPDEDPERAALAAARSEQPPSTAAAIA